MTITTMYLRQVKRTGLLGLIGYTVLGRCYLLLMNIAFIAGFVLPSIAPTNAGYVNDVLAAAPNGIAMIALGYSLWREQRTRSLFSCPDSSVLLTCAAPTMILW